MTAEINIYINCAIATMDHEALPDTPYGLIEDGCVVVQGHDIAWVGAALDLPAIYQHHDKIDLGGRLITPSLIDCHTHLIFGGNRAREFEMRLTGISYAEIARSGGGIMSTVNATRTASDADLLQSALTRIDDLIADGVGIIEIKSGYGLTIKDEIRMLRIAKSIEQHRDMIIKTTWLAAHAIPPEYENRADDYINDIVIAGLRQAHIENLVDAVDGFCENIAFTPDQMARVFDVAEELGLPVKLHAEQLSDQKGALLAAKYNGLSADHLEYLTPDDVPQFAQSDTVAVLLPGAYYTLRETKMPPMDALRQHHVPLAIATDCNPGSSPISSLLIVMNMACVCFKMTPEEALAGVTRHAAAALGMGADYGVIATGKKASFAVWDVDHPAQLSYWIGRSPLYKNI